MSKLQTMQSPSPFGWQQPLLLDQYDRRAQLSQAEQAALAEVLALKPGKPLLSPGRWSTSTLARLTRPLQDVYNLGHRCPENSISFLRCMFEQMAQTKTPFWIWSREEWQTALHTGNTHGVFGVKATMRVAAYLFCDLLILDEQFSPFYLARIMFGTELIEEQYERLAAVIFGNTGLGYVRNPDQERHLRAVVAMIMLVNRDPFIETFSVESLQATRQLLVCKANRYAFLWIVRALIYLKVASSGVLADIFGPDMEPSHWWEYTGSDVDPVWLAWVQAYVAQLSRGEEKYRKGEFYHLLIAGRWLKIYHPAITAPSQWDEALAQEFVTWTCSARRGELVADGNFSHHASSLAHVPLQATTLHWRIGALRRFFKALQRRSYQVDGQLKPRLVLIFDPDEVLATPEALKRQIVPNPRNLDHSWWQKLTWAAATLSAKDLATRRGTTLPLAYYRAAGLLWVTGARRADEIRRLKVGCVSREWAPEMRDEEGHQVEPEEDLCYLRVPVNKEMGSFWIPIPSYTADAIETWEQLRPKLQDPQIDRKEHKPTDYLFMTRNRLMGVNFLNRALIPLLCRVAGLIDEHGVPLRDAVGKITSHRARSTLATWLRSHGLSLTYIAKLLGHTDLRSLPWYLREDKHQFARAVRKHNPLDRMVTAILDTEALKRGEGQPAVFYYLGSGADGRPPLCASPDYQTCVHQMKCTECEMFVDADQAEVIARRPGVLTIEVHIPTPPLVATLLEQEEELGVEITRHLPAPDVPGPAYHFNKKALPRGNDPELEKMKRALEALTAEWAEKEEKFDLRSVGMKSLKKHIAYLAAEIERREASKPQIDPT